MDKKELVLRQLSTIALNNKIIELNNIIEIQNEKNASSRDKTKQLFSELIQNNKKLIAERKTLEEELNIAKKEVSNLKTTLEYQQTILNKIPRFLLKFISRNKNIKLLN